MKQPINDPDAAQLLGAEPQQLAQWLAIIGGDMPGFDNADRSALRRCAQALAGAGGADAARQIAAHAIRTHRNGAAWHTTRPEVALLAAVHHLVQQS